MDGPDPDLPLDRRPDRRQLVDLPDEPRDDLPHPLLRTVRMEAHEAHVLLVGGKDHVRETHGLPQSDREHAADVRVECSAVTDLLALQRVTHPRGGLMRCRARGLVEDYDSALQKLAYGTVRRPLAPLVRDCLGILSQHSNHGLPRGSSPGPHQGSCRRC